MQEIEEELAEYLIYIILGVFSPPFYPPKSPMQSAGPRLGVLNFDFEIEPNFNNFLTPIFDRFWVVLGCQVGVIFGTFGVQVGLPSVIC